MKYRKHPLRRGTRHHARWLEVWPRLLSQPIPRVPRSTSSSAARKPTPSSSRRQGQIPALLGQGHVGNPTDCASTDGNVFVTDNGDHQVMKFTRDGKLLFTLGVKGKQLMTTKPSTAQPTSRSARMAIFTCRIDMATRASSNSRRTASICSIGARRGAVPASSTRRTP